jgi:hypothetical protein
LLPSVEIPVARRPAALSSAEMASIAGFPVEPGMSLEQYVADGPVSGIVMVLAAWNAETPVPDEVQQQVQAELDHVDLTGMSRRRDDPRAAGRVFGSAAR